MSRHTLLPSAIFTLALFAAPMLACPGGIDTGGGGDGGTGDGGSTGDSGTTGDGGTTDGGTTDGGTTDGGTTDGGTEELPNIHGQVSGTVRVQLYTASEVDGEREFIAWEDTAFGEEFPFGAIFVSATQGDEGGGLFYRGDDTIAAPSVGGDPYSLTVTLPENGDVQVYATLDYHKDWILSSSEPIGTFPGEIEIKDGASVGDKDITILVDYDAALAWWQGGGGGGGGGGSCDNAVNLSGSATITTSWAGGDVAVMLYDTGGNGPYAYDRETPAVSGGGAEAAYSIDVCGPLGDMNVLGAWDSNGNYLIDPADMWGAYVTKPDVNGNPVAIETSSFTEMEVQIPLGDGRSGLNVVPFVSLNGNVTLQGGASFDDLAEGSVVYVAALLYRPEGDIAVSTIAEQAYDSDTWDASVYAGATALPYTLWVPGNTIVYLWSYVDEGPKPDGLVNTEGELVGSGGDDTSGRLPTGTSSSTGLTVDLGYGG